MTVLAEFGKRESKPIAFAGGVFGKFVVTGYPQLFIDGSLCAYAVRRVSHEMADCDFSSIVVGWNDHCGWQRRQVLSTRLLIIAYK